jgi:2-dehydro-3-deoxygalactonokinase
MAALIALDWGTSSLRAYLLDAAGAILETRQRPWGLRNLPGGGFDAALADIARGWPRCARIASGMVGARGGWREIPYLGVPADPAQLARSLGEVRAADGERVHLVPGLRDPQGPDVMRGEETQVLGAIARDPALAAHATLLLPGTHSKWVDVRAGRIAGFRTAMTGELFALLLKHSILGAGIGPDARADDAAAFLRGVAAARDSGAAGALSRIFAIRARTLDGSLVADELPSFLSGLLIGEEIRGMTAARAAETEAPIALVGNAALCARYRDALQAFGSSATLAADDAAAQGLWRIAIDAGLVAAALPQPEEHA